MLLLAPLILNCSGHWARAGQPLDPRRVLRLCVCACSRSQAAIWAQQLNAFTYRNLVRLVNAFTYRDLVRLVAAESCRVAYSDLCLQHGPPHLRRSPATPNFQFTQCDKESPARAPCFLHQISCPHISPQGTPNLKLQRRQRINYLAVFLLHY